MPLSIQRRIWAPFWSLDAEAQATVMAALDGGMSPVKMAASTPKVHTGTDTVPRLLAHVAVLSEGRAVTSQALTKIVVPWMASWRDWTSHRDLALVMLATERFRGHAAEFGPLRTFNALVDFVFVAQASSCLAPHLSVFALDRMLSYAHELVHDWPGGLVIEPDFDGDIAMRERETAALFEKVFRVLASALPPDEATVAQAWADALADAAVQVGHPVEARTWVAIDAAFDAQALPMGPIVAEAEAIDVMVGRGA